MKLFLGTLVLCLPLSWTARAGEPVARCPDEDPLCKEVALEAPEEARVVVAQRGPATLVFGLEAFSDAAKARRGSQLATWLAGQKGHEIRLVRAEAHLTKEIDFVIAGLLEEGRAKVLSKAGQPVERIVVQRWDWVGCGGGCRQAGREFRLVIPGKPFLKTTDLYEDGEPGTFYPPPVRKPASE